MNQPAQSIWYDDARRSVTIIDQRWLPHELVLEEIADVPAMCAAIRDMHLRGAPLIGVAAAYGLLLACLAGPAGDAEIRRAADRLLATRPTAVNLRWAVERQLEALRPVRGAEERRRMALATARAVEREDIERCRRIGEHGLPLIQAALRRRADGPPEGRGVVNVLTHCNAGWLACVRHGTATAPIYAAHEAGLPVHVWVDETRPRNQGARLTAWELGRAGVPHTVIADNAGGHLMQQGRVDLVIVGADRISRRGDAANKIGTYLKALAARDNGVPFYVAAPSSTVDWRLEDGLRDIPIEERPEEEVRAVSGWLEREGRPAEVRILPELSPALNPAFDVTPARLITGLITERGVCPATAEGLGSLFPRDAS